MEISYYKIFPLNNASLGIIEMWDYNNVLTLLNEILHIAKGDKGEMDEREKIGIIGAGPAGRSTAWNSRI